MDNSVFASDPLTLDGPPRPVAGNVPAAECLGRVVSNDWVNADYKRMVVDAPAQALTAKAGQFFQMLCPSPDDGDLWLRRPMSIYLVDAEAGRLEFLYKRVGRGTVGLTTMEPGDDLNIVGPLGVGFSLDPSWRHIVVHLWVGGPCGGRSHERGSHKPAPAATLRP